MHVRRTRGAPSRRNAAAATVRDMESLIGAMFLTLVVGIAVLQIIAIDFHAEQGLLARISEYDRPEGWSGYPELGLIVCVQIAILIALFQAVRDAPWRAAIVLVVAVSVVELIFLFSRMAWVTAAALLAVSAAAGTPINRVWKPALGALIVAALVVVGIAGSATGRNLLVSLTERTASASRLVIWERTARMIEDHPLVGVGAGNFRRSSSPSTIRC